VRAKRWKKKQKRESSKVESVWFPSGKHPQHLLMKNLLMNFCLSCSCISTLYSTHPWSYHRRLQPGNTLGQVTPRGVTWVLTRKVAFMVWVSESVLINKEGGCLGLTMVLTSSYCFIGYQLGTHTNKATVLGCYLGVTCSNMINGL
jgi:hypothetical protein